MSVATPTTVTVGLCLEPLDILFFRDGRPFTGSERSVSGLPLPQTFAGAMRTALLRWTGCNFERLKQSLQTGKGFHGAVEQVCGADHRWIGGLTVRGPWLARLREANSELEVLVPVPAVLHKEKKGTAGMLRSMAPLPAGQLPGWTSPEHGQGLRPTWLKHLPATEPVRGYLTQQGLEQFVRGGDVSASAALPESELFGLDYRTGIGISRDRLVAEESQIFGRGFLALRKHVFLYAEVEVPEDAALGSFLDDIETLPLGGEGRHALIRRLDQPFDWPKPPELRGREKPLVLVTTPCAFQSCWQPEILDGHIVAAVVPGAVAFSGWNLAWGGPKPTRFAVPAGTVYFLETLADSLPDSLAESDEERKQGWGCYLKGVWTDA